MLDAAGIEELLLAENVDLVMLRAVSRQKGGFLNNSLRSRVWAKLLSVNRYDLVDYRVYLDPHRDEAQVKMDVDRSLWSFKQTSQWATAHRENRRTALCNIIRAILCRHSQLYYYQGFHDAVSVFVLVVEEDHLAFALAERASLHFFRDYMHKDFHLVSKLAPLLFDLVASADPELARYLQAAGLEPFFAISWLLTWFSHDVKDLAAVARIFDALLCSPPAFSLYVAAAYLLHLRAHILAADCDLASLHSLLVHAPEQLGLPFEALLPRADALLAAVPPQEGLARLVRDRRAQALMRRGRVAAFRREPALTLAQAQAQGTRGAGAGAGAGRGQGGAVPADWVLLRRQHLRRLGGAAGGAAGEPLMLSAGAGQPVRWGWRLHSEGEDQGQSEGSSSGGGGGGGGGSGEGSSSRSSRRGWGVSAAALLGAALAAAVSIVAARLLLSPPGASLA